jgi:hypothetical protein
MLTSELRVPDSTCPEKLPNLAFRLAAVATQFTRSLTVVIFAGHDPLT